MKKARDLSFYYYYYFSAQPKMANLGHGEGGGAEVPVKGEFRSRARATHSGAEGRRQQGSSARSGGGGSGGRSSSLPGLSGVRPVHPPRSAKEGRKAGSASPGRLSSFLSRRVEDSSARAVPGWMHSPRSAPSGAPSFSPSCVQGARSYHSSVRRSPTSLRQPD